MTRIQIARALCELSGVRNIVTNYNAGTYTDANIATPASYWINAGIRLLDRRWAQTGTYRRVEVPIETGQVYFQLPKSKFVQLVETTNDDGDRFSLIQTPHRELREKYADEWADVDRDVPLYWTRAYGQVNSSDVVAFSQFATSATLTNTDPTGNSGAAILAANPNVWYAYPTAAWTHDAGADSMTYTANASVPRLGLHVGSDKNAGVSFTITADVSVDSIGVAVGYWNGTSFSAIDSSSTLLTGDGTITFTPNITWNMVFLFAAESGTFTTPVGTLNFALSTSGAGEITGVGTSLLTPDFTSEWFAALPPSDAARTLTVFGDFSAPLDADTDTNWWTVNHPNLVIRAARAELELDLFRNVSGMTGFLGQIEAELERMLALDRLAYISAMSPQEACING